MLLEGHYHAYEHIYPLPRDLENKSFPGIPNPRGVNGATILITTTGSGPNLKLLGKAPGGQYSFRTSIFILNFTKTPLQFYPHFLENTSSLGKKSWEKCPGVTLQHQWGTISPIVSDVFQSISYRFLTDFLRRSSIMIVVPQTGYLAGLIASGYVFV